MFGLLVAAHLPVDGSNESRSNADSDQEHPVEILRQKNSLEHRGEQHDHGVQVALPRVIPALHELDQQPKNTLSQ